MYHLLFGNKWFAALWAGMTLLGIYLTTPREDGTAPFKRLTAVALEASGVTPDEAAKSQARDELLRQHELDVFNAGEEEAAEEGEGFAAE